MDLKRCFIHSDFLTLIQTLLLTRVPPRTSSPVHITNLWSSSSFPVLRRFCATVQAQVRHINETSERLSEADRANRAAQLQRTMGLLLHVSRCHDLNCPSMNCLRIKQLFDHAVQCNKKVSGGCNHCR